LLRPGQGGRPLPIVRHGRRHDTASDSVSAIWKTSEDETARQVQLLVEIGFFEEREGGGLSTFWVPFLYRDGLFLSQGPRRGVVGKAATHRHCCSPIPCQFPPSPMMVFPLGVEHALDVPVQRPCSRPISANEKTPPRLDGVKFGRRRQKIANVPPDGSCHDSGELQPPK
jgi:hypothetical protein